jgi:SAM-dependent methyltransferase
MQKMINLMIEYTGLSTDSRFIDVGCGLGKPCFHVAQYPGVDFSYGIEMEHTRWMLGMSNLEHVLKAAVEDEEIDNNTESKIGHHLYFSHGDITEADYFDPFTHVYMFDIG